MDIQTLLTHGRYSSNNYYFLLDKLKNTLIEADKDKKEVA